MFFGIWFNSYNTKKNTGSEFSSSPRPTHNNDYHESKRAGKKKKKWRKVVGSCEFIPSVWQGSVGLTAELNPLRLDRCTRNCERAEAQQAVGDPRDEQSLRRLCYGQKQLIRGGLWHGHNYHAVTSWMQV